MKRLLIVEDEEVIAKALKRMLERNRYSVDLATTVEQAIACEPSSYDLILADLRLPGAEGTAVIPEADPAPVVIMTSHASVRSAVEAMRHGAIDYIAKPFDHDELLMVVGRALSENLLQAQNNALRLDVERLSANAQTIENTEIEGLLELACKVRDNDRFIHLYGERGTDREGLARAIHTASNRRDAPFLIAEIQGRSQAEDVAQLFGQAGNESIQAVPANGYIQAAQHGTLVIRHPERLHASAQLSLANLFSVNPLQQSNRNRHTSQNLHIITVAESTVDELVAKQGLIDELATLLAPHQLGVPSLRQRPGDIMKLAARQLEYLLRRHDISGLEFTDDAVAALLAYQWPGNVAELNAVITRAALLCSGNRISVEALGLSVESSGARDMSLDEYFRFAVLRNQKHLSETELATRLGISRKALWERRQKMNLLRDNAEGSSTPRR